MTGQSDRRNDLDRLIAGLREDPACVFAPPAGGSALTLPADLVRFYELCGGLTLFRDADFAWRIVGPHELAPTNPEVIGEQVDDDITATWFVIARQDGYSSALISIDLDPKRLGWCYDSHFEVHGLVGDCAILAYSFTELLEQLIDSRGQYIFWKDARFVSKGDAYDPIDNASL